MQNKRTHHYLREYAYSNLQRKGYEKRR